MTGVALPEVLSSMFDNSLEASLKEVLPNDNWQFSTTDNINQVDEKEALFLSICSHQFRIFVAIHFTLANCEEFVSTGLNVSTEALNSKASYDFLLETSNSLCGMLKRELGNAVPALGMSTPNILEKGSFEFIDIFNTQAQHFQKVELNNQTLFFAGYYYCPNIDQEIEVEIQETQSELDSGELELF